MLEIGANDLDPFSEKLVRQTMQTIERHPSDWSMQSQPLKLNVSDVLVHNSGREAVDSEFD